MTSPAPRAKDCLVCCLPFTSVKRIRVTCAYCQYEACQDCYRTYVTTNMQDAHCMSCRQTWSRDVLTSTFPPSWVNGAYKKHRETILVEREKQLLPESQELVANYRQAKHYRASAQAKTDEMQVLKRKYNQLNREIWNDRHRAERYEYNGYRGVANAGADVATKKAKVDFICPCPVEECRGFMNAQMECGVCGNTACTECGVLLPRAVDEAGTSKAAADHVPHVCDKNVAANFKEIKKHTKPCPKCAVPTYKVSGCSQMWCTECQTTWDWNSGDIVKGVIHNPHYFAYMRERSKNGEIPRQPGDGPQECDRQRFPSAWDVSRMTRSSLQKAFGKANPENPDYVKMEEKTNNMMSFQRKMIHINEVELPTLRHRYRNTDNADLRLKYLINDISEDEFKVQLQRREKKREKDVAIRDIYQMACDTCRDVLWEFVTGTRPIESTMEELEEIRKYANQHLYTVSNQYKMKITFV